MEQLQCLEELGVDLDATLPRFLGNKNFYLKMLAKFLDDPNYDLLEKSLQEQDYETAFRAVHTLKGVSVNMGLNLLYDETVLLTEELRKPPYDEDKISMFFQETDRQYHRCVEVIQQLPKDLPCGE